MGIVKPTMVEAWTEVDVGRWLTGRGLGAYGELFIEQGIDGEALLLVDEDDLRKPPLAVCKVGDIKKIMKGVKELREGGKIPPVPPAPEHANLQRKQLVRLAAAAGYCGLSIFTTSFSLVAAHERVPLTDQYPPLPDIVLDNVPRISWAFAASEVFILTLGGMLISLLIIHKSRVAILTRFLAISATVFLLRCVTMLATSLSVPGAHLECEQLTLPSFEEKLDRALHIMMGLGSTVFGIETCGDYMFSGHCTGLTLLACFICEYTPTSWTSFHRAVWLLCIFGIFCILAAHEHYSIDCFVAFYISSRVFAYYHSLAYQVSTMSPLQWRRLGVWFPLVAYFERFTPPDGYRNAYELPYLGKEFQFDE